MQPTQCAEVSSIRSVCQLLPNIVLIMINIPDEVVKRCGLSSSVGEKEELSSAEPKTSFSGEVKRKRKRNDKTYIHGNYEHYYGYRNQGEPEKDGRLQCFDDSWFRDKVSQCSAR